MYRNKSQFIFTHKDFPYVTDSSWWKITSNLQKRTILKKISKTEFALSEFIPKPKTEKEWLILVTNLPKREEKNTSILQNTIKNKNSARANTPYEINTLLELALWDENANIHNINIKVIVPNLFTTLKSNGNPINTDNGSIQIINRKINNLTINGFVYPNNTFMIFIRNTFDPIIINIGGIIKLRSVLEQIRISLSEFVNEIPEVDTGFEVVKFDYAHDGKLLQNVSVNYNYIDIEKQLIQIYTKRSNKLFTKIRIEKRDTSPNEMFFGEFVSILLPHNFRKT